MVTLPFPHTIWPYRKERPIWWSRHSEDRYGYSTIYVRSENWQPIKEWPSQAPLTFFRRPTHIRRSSGPLQVMNGAWTVCMRPRTGDAEPKSPFSSINRRDKRQRRITGNLNQTRLPKNNRVAAVEGLVALAEQDSDKGYPAQAKEATASG